MTGRIIVVEGPEATGKTTLCTALRDEIDDSVYYHCPTGDNPFTDGLYGLLKDYSDIISENTKRAAIMVTHIENITRMNKLKREGHTVICDRSILTYFAYQGASKLVIDHEFSAFRVPVLLADKYIVLTATEEDTLARLRDKHNVDSYDEYFIRNMKQIRRRYSCWPEIYPRKDTVVLNTSELSQSEVIEQARRHIE